MSTLYRHATLLSSPTEADRAVLVHAGRIRWLGADAESTAGAGPVDEVIDLEGALLTAAFVDSHVHLSATGAGLRGIDLTDATSLAEALRRIEAGGRRSGGRPLYAPNWDESAWPEGRAPTARELDRASYGGVVYAPRIDGHSAVLSSALTAASGADSLPGWHGDGLVTRESHHAARDGFSASISPAQRRADIDLALTTAAGAGIGMVHECGGPTVSSAVDFADVMAAGTRGVFPVTRGSWGQLVQDEQEARAVAALHGTSSLAGDLNVDGSVGSRTAHLREPYADAPGHRGNAYLTVAQVRDHVAACSLAGLQAGFHVIGDAAADTTVAGFDAAAALVGDELVRRGRHRLEHLEMIDRAGIRRLADLGVTASVQPAFDAAWGGPSGMYAARLGRERVAGMNTYTWMSEAGMTVAFGSDSPVTSIAPWEGVRACLRHRHPELALDAEQALVAQGIAGWRASGIDDAGQLVVGQSATFATWDPGTSTPGSVVDDLQGGGAAPRCLRTVVGGATAYEA